MCGIAGIINRNNDPVNKNDIYGLTEPVVHRGPDHAGYFFGPNFAFGHRRLAIIDLSPLGNQPMSYRNRYNIIFNGEVYNYIELRQELQNLGYLFHSQSDTEVILAAYDKWGKDCLHRFNGMWAFAIYDSHRGSIFLSRDRFGIKPLYYSLQDSQFTIASEIKQFTALKSWRARPNLRRSYEFLVYGLRNHSDETMFEGVWQLPAGHNLHYDLKSHQFTVKQWYHLERAIPKSDMDFISARDEFSRIFTDAVRLRLRSDVKVGSCLSGGLDSSSIVCLANGLLRREKAHHQQETVSSCFVMPQYDEQEHIDEVARLTGIVSHRVYPGFDDLFSKLDRIIWHQDEPFVSTSIFAQWEVFRGAADHCLTVMLDGQGADEILGGYRIFYGKFLSNLFRHFRFLHLAREIRSLRQLQNLPIHQLARMVLGNLPPETLRKAFRTLYANDMASALNYSNHESAYEPWRQPTRNMRQESLTEMRYTHLPLLLHYEDRNSMAHSIESRLPFLDFRIVEFVLGLPDHHKINRAATKYILREACRSELPPGIVNRHDKMGFVTPEEIWLKKNSDRFRQELNETVALSGGLINNKIIDIFEDVCMDRRDFDFTIWRFISFGRWLKVFNISPGPAN